MVVRSQNCLRNIRRLGFLRIQRWNSARIALASVNSQARMLTLRGFDTAFDAEHRPRHDRTFSSELERAGQKPEIGCVRRQSVIVFQSKAQRNICTALCIRSFPIPTVQCCLSVLQASQQASKKRNIGSN